MEVHHHSGHSGKKGWKSYFWEFLMLFLAVFCGFLAEYQLEHIIEHNREKQFIKSYIEDLKTDTANIRLNIAFRKEKLSSLDSLMFLLSLKDVKGHENELYFRGRLMVRNTTFQSNDRTMIQLRNSGSLRLIRNEMAADSMISYQKLVTTISLNQDDERNERYDAYPILSRLFSPFVFDKMVTIDGVIRPEKNLPLRTYDMATREDLAFYVHQIKGSNYIILNRLEQLNVKAQNTIVFLTKQYRLK